MLPVNGQIKLKTRFMFTIITDTCLLKESIPSCSHYYFNEDDVTQNETSIMDKAKHIAHSETPQDNIADKKE